MELSDLLFPQTDIDATLGRVALVAIGQPEGIVRVGRLAGHVRCRMGEVGRLAGGVGRLARDGGCLAGDDGRLFVLLDCILLKNAFLSELCTRALYKRLSLTALRDGPMDSLHFNYLLIVVGHLASGHLAGGHLTGDGFSRNLLDALLLSKGRLVRYAYSFLCISLTSSSAPGIWLANAWLLIAWLPMGVSGTFSSFSF